MARIMLTFSMDPDLARRLKAAAGDEGERSLSRVACELIEIGLQRRGMLVAYNGAPGTENGEPETIVPGAVRVWGNTSWLKGWADPEGLPGELPAMLRGLEANKPNGGRRGTADWIADALRRGGWLVQVVDDRGVDILEVWAYKPGDACQDCKKLAAIRGVLDAED